MCVRRASVLMVLMLASLAWSAQSGSVRPDADRTRDVQQTIKARKLLADEPELAGCNIGVVVRDRVATLWGPVASAEVAFRAELCLRTMVELAAVRNELFVSDQLEERQPLKINRPPLLLPDRLPPKLPIDPLRVPEVQTPIDPAQVKPGGATIRVASRDAVAPPMPPAELLTPAERELAAAVRAILQSQPAYREVQFAVQDGRVYLKAATADSSVLHEVARAVARLPKVDNVILLEKAR